MALFCQKTISYLEYVVRAIKDGCLELYCQSRPHSLKTNPFKAIGSKKLEGLLILLTIAIIKNDYAILLQRINAIDSTVDAVSAVYDDNIKTLPILKNLPRIFTAVFQVFVTQLDIGWGNGFYLLKPSEVMFDGHDFFYPGRPPERAGAAAVFKYGHLFMNSILDEIDRRITDPNQRLAI